MSQLSMLLEEPVDELNPYLFGKFLFLRVADGDIALERFERWLGDERFVALDFETLAPKEASINTPIHFDRAQVLLAALSHRGGTAVLYLSPEESERCDELWRPFLQRLLDRVVIVHNASYDIPFVHRITGELPQQIWDTMVLFGLVTAGKAVAAVLKSQALAAMVQALFGVSVDKSVRETFLLDKFRGLTRQQCSYAAEDARWTYLAAQKLIRLCEQHGILHVAELEARLTPVLLRMQLRGVAVDLGVVQSYASRLQSVSETIYSQMLDLFEQDRWTVWAATAHGEPLTLHQLVPIIRSGSAEPVYLLRRPVHLSHFSRSMLSECYPVKPEQAINPRSTSQWQSYLGLVTSGRLTTTDSKAVESFLSDLEKGLVELDYHECMGELLAKLLRKLMDYRAVEKIQSTYLTAWSNLERDGRIHTTYVQTYAESGRISSRHPNLQNCPRPDTTSFLVQYLGEPMDMRSMFVAPPGYVLITADYSQYELRVAAAMSSEPRMVEVYRQDGELRAQLESLVMERYGLHPWQMDECKSLWESDPEVQALLKGLKDMDFHTQNAARIFRKQPAEVTKQERSEAKGISFGVLYGMQAQGLALQIKVMTGRDISKEEAQQLLDAYFSVYRNLAAYIRRTHHDARRYGYVCSAFGRKRWCVFSRYRDKFGLRVLLGGFDSATEREAMNHTIQATNADATKWALVLLHEQLERRGWTEHAYPVLTVHDEIVVECREELQHDVAAILRDCMVEGSRLAGLVDVPTIVEVAIDRAWRK